MNKATRLVFEGSMLSIGLSLAASSPAHAYLDPGTGSYALQIAVAGAFGAMYTVKVFWSKIKETAASSFRARAARVENTGQ